MFNGLYNCGYDQNGFTLSDYVACNGLVYFSFTFGPAGVTEWNENREALEAAAYAARRG